MRARHSQKGKTRILLADREGVFRLGLKKLFAIEDDLRVVAEAENCAQVLALTKSFRPDVLLVEAEIAQAEPGNLIAKSRHVLSASKVVITASALTEDETLRYVQAGAAGVILKSVDPPLFVKCVRKVMNNEVWLPKQQVAQMARLLEGAPERHVRPVDTLTHREKTIISYLIQGWRNRQIAEQLSITEQTVKNHLRTIYDKVGVSDRLELALYAIYQRLELPPLGPSQSHL